MPLTIASQNDGHILVAEGADCEQHGGGLRGDETEGHVLPGLRGNGRGGLWAAVTHHKEGVLEGIRHWGAFLKWNRHLCNKKQSVVVSTQQE